MIQLFKKKNRPHLVPSSELLITGSTTSTGSIVCEEDIFLDNKHTGDITCKGLVTLGPNAIAKGNVTARVVKVYGSLSGSINAKEAIALESNSHVRKGTLTGKAISIQPSATLNDVNLTIS